MDGILLVNKPAGVTSHDVVGFIRSKFETRKVGHGGTLDPLATGLLIIMLGKATKLSQRIIKLDKEYLAEITFGFSTDSGDLAGEIIEKSQDSGYLELSQSEIKEATKFFIGEIEQVPPMYSALKYQGQRLYKLARQGIEIARKPRKVRVYNFDIVAINLPRIIFKIRCSRGFYIRQLCIDLGKKLGYPAHLSKIVRLSIGKFRLDEAQELNKILNEFDFKKYLIPINIARRLISL